MNDYLPLLGLFIFVAVVGGIGMLANFALDDEYRREKEAKRKAAEAAEKP